MAKNVPLNGPVLCACFPFSFLLSFLILVFFVFKKCGGAHKIIGLSFTLPDYFIFSLRALCDLTVAAYTAGAALAAAARCYAPE